MDITDCLKQDHEQALELARRMGKQDDPNQARALYKALREALSIHSRAEEGVVYRALDKLGVQKVSDMTHEGEVEHSLCDHLLALMARGRPETTRWKARAIVVYELLEHHIEEEHDEMFKMLRQHFDAAARASLADQFERRKAQLAAGRPVS